MNTSSIPCWIQAVNFLKYRLTEARRAMAVVSALTSFAAPAPCQRGLTKFVLSDGFPHVVSIDARSHVVELFFQNQRWSYNDLTSSTQTPLAATKSNLTSFILSDGMPHIVFIANNQHVVQLFYQDHQWAFNDLTASSHAPAPGAGTRLTSFVLRDGSPRIVFVDGKQHVDQVFYRDNKWIFNDLTASSGAPMAARESGLTSFILADGLPHIVSIDEHKHLSELFYRDNKWAFNDITAKGKAPAVMAESGLTTFILKDGLPHVVAVDVHQHITELLFQNQEWASNDLSSAAGAPDSMAGSELTNFVLRDGLPHVEFIDGQRHVQELFFANHKWLRNDLTASGHGPAAEPQSGLISFVLGDGFPHVVFKDERRHVNEMFFQTSKWLCNDLTASSSGK